MHPETNINPNNIVKGTIGNTVLDYEKVCVDGVEYLERTSGHKGYFAPHMKPDGSLYTCQ